MQRYARTARRYRLLLVAILAIIWGAGCGAALVEYSTTYQSEATVWVLRTSPSLATSIDDTTTSSIQTAASQQAEMLNQLLQTKSFLREVVRRTSLVTSLSATTDDTKLLGDLAKRFRVQTLGSNLVSVSYTAHDARTPFEMVKSALEVRDERVAQARVASTTAASTLYRKQLEVAQQQAADSQRQLDEFNQSHPEPLSAADSDRQAQLRLALDFAQVRLVDLKGRIDQSLLAPALLELSGMDFQVIDQPREESSPSGGTRTAATLAVVAIAAGTALAALFVVLGTLLADKFGGPVDVARLAPVKLFASVPHVRAASSADQADLRRSLAAVAFGEGSPGSGPGQA